VVLIAVYARGHLRRPHHPEALGGYGDPTVWLVQRRFFISNALIRLASRGALRCCSCVPWAAVRLGVCYALSLTDMVLAPIIPFEWRALRRRGAADRPLHCELYGSQPGPRRRSSARSFSPAFYQSVCITSAMFMTGQASKRAGGANFHANVSLSVTFPLWALAESCRAVFAAGGSVAGGANQSTRNSPDARSPRLRRERAQSHGRMDRGQKNRAGDFSLCCGDCG